MRLTANLQHPNLLPLFDSGGVDGLLFYVMPYVDGGSLRARLDREKQLPIGEAVKVATAVTSALAYMHRHGIVHRDLKPENILLQDGEPLVADLGIALALGTQDARRLTGTGISVGTPEYMSPEQAAGDRELDGRSDIFSLGAVLYEMLAGEPPFTGPTAQAVIAKRLASKAPSVRITRPSVPAALDDVLAKSLAAVPGDRYQTAEEFSTAANAALAADASGLPVVSTRRRLPRAVAAVMVLALAVSAVYVRRHTSGVDEKRTLAVLPFENVGDSADAYFAEGVADDIRGKLASLGTLRVIASGSSNQYRHTAKPPAEIARELGVRYLLVGRVQWRKSPGTAIRVRVAPELVDAGARGVPTIRWQSQFDGEVADVFGMQAQIATGVADSLRIALGAGARAALEAHPTRNLDAYDAYLRGRALLTRSIANADVRRAVAALTEAVRRDDQFAHAWAALAEAGGIMFIAHPTPKLADSVRYAAERALALAPELPEARAATGRYYENVQKDHVRALAEYATGLVHAPNDALLLRRTAGAEMYLGRWPEAVRHLHEAALIEPRLALVVNDLGQAELFLHQFPEARVDLERALALEPGDASSVQFRAMVEVAARGDLDAARAVLRRAKPVIRGEELAAFFGENLDLGWMLDDADQSLLLSLSPTAFGGERGTWAIALAQLYAVRRDTIRARAYADSARLADQAALHDAPDDAQSLAELGLALAYMGRSSNAIREGERAVRLEPVDRNAIEGPYLAYVLARIYLIAGRQDDALTILEALARQPYFLTPAWLRVDPYLTPLRGNLRFQRLVGA
jgi:serine/threonine-protein kinase